MRDVIDAIIRWRAAGERVALATVIAVHGSAPRSEGAKMAVAQNGKITGSVSGGCVESAVAEEAQQVLRSGKARIVSYGINRNMMWDVGLSCGGTIDVLIEPLLTPADPSEWLETVARLLQAGSTFVVCTLLRPDDPAGIKRIIVPGQGVVAATPAAHVPGSDQELLQAVQRQIERGRSHIVPVAGQDVFLDVSIPEPRLLIVGAVHVATALCEMATLSGFDVTVVDPRPALNNRERFPHAKELRVGWPEDELPQLKLDDNTYIAVLTHDEKFDDPTVLYALPRPVRYLGAIGSKKTQALRRERLLAAGMRPEQVARIRGPIGLDIGAQTPEEIAVAILSEMIAEKYQRAGAPLRDRVEPHIHV